MTPVKKIEEKTVEERPKPRAKSVREKKIKY